MYFDCYLCILVCIFIDVGHSIYRYVQALVCSGVGVSYSCDVRDGCATLGTYQNSPINNERMLICCLGISTGSSFSRQVMVAPGVFSAFFVRLYVCIPIPICYSLSFPLSMAYIYLDAQFPGTLAL